MAPRWCFLVWTVAFLWGVGAHRGEHREQAVQPAIHYFADGVIGSAVAVISSQDSVFVVVGTVDLEEFNSVLYVLNSNLEIAGKLPLLATPHCQYQFEKASEDVLLVLCPPLVYKVGLQQESGQVELLDVAELPATDPTTGYLFVGADDSTGFVIGGVRNDTGRYFRLYSIDVESMTVTNTPALDNHLLPRVILTDQGIVAPDRSYIIVPFFQMDNDAPSDPGLLKIFTSNWTKIYRGEFLANPPIIFGDSRTGFVISTSDSSRLVF